MTIGGYKVRKAAQVTAFFAMKEGGSINVLKLAKLLYIADREHLKAYDLPILFDCFVSMDHGPVTSITLGYVNGYQSDRGNWDAFISDRSGYSVGLKDADLSIHNLDELNDAELRTLGEVWSEFGEMDKYAVRNWTHEHCGEWEDPKGSSAPIPYERVLKNLGKKSASDIAEHIEDLRNLDRALSHAL